jgi:hypothetical protein
MKRAVLVMAMMVLGGALAACDPEDGSSSYDPRIDGVLPRQQPGEEPGILDNQLKRPHPVAKAAPTGTAPASRPGTTPPPPTEGAPATTPAPPVEG